MIASWVTKALKLVLLLACLVAPSAYVSSLSQGSGPVYEDYWAFVKNNYIVFFGMPYAAALAYLLISFVEGTRGRVEFELLGMKFKGASGPLVFWILIFLAILLGFKLLWNGAPEDKQSRCDKLENLPSPN